GAPITRAGRDRVVFFQNADAALFPWLTAEENVAFGLRIAGVPPARRAQVVEQHLRLVGLWDDRAKYPRQLSGGMKQRIQIARGLAIDPAILLMDEPFAALDAITRRFMHAELLRIWAATGKTIVFVTHDVGEAIVLADRIGVMTRGPAASLKAVAVGFALGSALGIVLGVLMGRIHVVHDLLDPVIEFFRFLSPTAMIPIAVIWFGIGETSKYFLIFWGTFFIVLINAIHGVMATPWARVRAAECLGATQAQIFALIVLPSAIPSIVTGMRVALASSYLSIIPAEILAAD